MKQILFILQLLTVVAVGFLSGTGIAYASGLDPLITGGITSALSAGASLLFQGSQMAFASAISITDLVTEYGAYYKGDANRRQRLRDKLYNTGNSFDDHFMSVPTDNTREEFAYSEQTAVLQPYQVAWTSKGDHSIKPNVATLYWAKMDLDYIPDYLVLSWAGFLRENKLDASQCPFIQYVLENHIIPKAHEDWYLNVAFGGAYAAPTPGTAGAAATTADGVRELIRDLNTASTITPFTMGAPPSDPVLFCEYMEDMSAQIPEQHRKRKLVWRMSEELRLLYLEGFNELHNKFWKQSEQDVNSIPIFQYQNMKVEGFENMNGSDMIFTAPKENSWKLMKGGAKQEIFKVETLKRSVFMFTDFHAGYFFPDPREVWVNDQDLS